MKVSVVVVASTLSVSIYVAVNVAPEANERATTTLVKSLSSPVTSVLVPVDTVTVLPAKAPEAERTCASL